MRHNTTHKRVIALTIFLAGAAAMTVALLMPDSTGRSFTQQTGLLYTRWRTWGWPAPLCSRATQPARAELTRISSRYGKTQTLTSPTYELPSKSTRSWDERQPVNGSVFTAMSSTIPAGTQLGASDHRGRLLVIIKSAGEPSVRLTRTSDNGNLAPNTSCSRGPF